ncbi:MAG: hypothetical protein HC868_07850 [Sphingomonadales bacterium]|nr:hypothetical protein [Sphingomonadales bacterium]
MAGETVLGAMVFEFFSPGTAQVMAHAGAEYIIYDMEHTGISSRPSRRRWPTAAASASLPWCACRAANITSSPAPSTSAVTA